MIVSYLLLFIAGITVCYAIKNSCKLLVCMDLIEEANKAGAIPDSNLIEKVDKILSVLCDLLIVAITLMIAFQTINSNNHG